jgi:hypothetical protein
MALSGPRTRALSTTETIVGGSGEDTATRPLAPAKFSMRVRRDVVAVNAYINGYSINSPSAVTAERIE